MENEGMVGAEGDVATVGKHAGCQVACGMLGFECRGLIYL